MKTSQVRTFLSLVWLVFTLSLVTWWFIFAVRNLNGEEVTESAKHYKMLFYEGSTLLLSILIGGVVLIVLSYRDDRRHQKLKMFFSNFTHEIKTSITRIRLQADVLIEEDILKSNKILQRLLTDVAKLDLQLENSLLLSHVEESTFLNERIDLSVMIDSIQMEFEDIRIRVKGTAVLQADTRALKSILRNLLENARRHGQATEVAVTVDQVGDGQIKIAIQDNGVGNTRSDIKLGQGILSTSAHQGSGIGLYLSKQLIQKMNGDIEFNVSNSQGFQAVFKIKRSQLVKKILLVEDDFSLGQTLSDRLGQDYDLVWVQNAEQALSKIKAMKELSLIILDVGLPGGQSGFELAVHVRKIAKTPFLFLTAQADAESRLRGYQLGAEEFIPKPFHLKELLIRIDHVLRLHTPIEMIQSGGVEINFSDLHILNERKEKINLSSSEMQVLEILIKRSPKVVDRDDIMNEVWGLDSQLSHRSIDNIIVKIRSALSNEGANIKTIRGRGYQWLNEKVNQ